MDLKLKNKCALVCAASDGLGFASADALAGEGCRLVIVSSNEARIRPAADRLVASHPSLKGHISTEVVDLTKPTAVSALVEKLLASGTAIDILVNNVGGPPPSSALGTEKEDWQLGFERLFLSATTLTNGLLPAMRERGFGRIINITSTSVSEPIDHLAVSSAMRAGVTGYAKLLSREVARHGVTVNSLMPGVIHTRRIENLRAMRAAREGTTLDQEMEKTAREIPALRIGKPEELGALVAFLASPLAGYITGQNIAVDGGALRGWS